MQFKHCRATKTTINSTCDYTTRLFNSVGNQVSRLSEIEDLYLQDCVLSCLPDLSQFTKLKSIYIDRCVITDTDILGLGKIPASSKINDIHIEDCFGRIDIPRNLEYLQHLTSIYLSNVEINSIDFDINSMKALKFLTIKNCDVPDTSLSLGKRTGLGKRTVYITSKTLKVIDYQDNSCVPVQLAFDIDSPITDITISGSHLEQIPDDVLLLKNLNVLNVSDNDITDLSNLILPSTKNNKLFFFAAFNPISHVSDNLLSKVEISFLDPIFDKNFSLHKMLKEKIKVLEKEISLGINVKKNKSIRNSLVNQINSLS